MKVDDTGGQRPTFLVRFHGVRGSHPVASPDVATHGGNTSCVELEVGGRRLILDCGTGAIALGRRLVAEADSDAGSGGESARHSEAHDPPRVADPLQLLMLLSHAHHDHTMGFCFFVPVYAAGARLHLAGPGREDRSFQDVFEGAFADPFFPVPADAMPSRRSFTTLEDGDSLAWAPGAEAPRRLEGDDAPGDDDVVVRVFRNVRHPNGGVLCFRVEHAGRSVTMATDVEGSEGVDGDLVDFARETDLLIHDAQYTDEEYESSKVGWGHSTWRMAADVAWRSQARRLALYHHDPRHDDVQLAEIERQAREKFPRCVMACEGLEIRL